MPMSDVKSSGVILITGPARSGKSEWGERLAAQSATQFGQRVVYVATAIAPTDDAEWLARLEAHRNRRPADWETLEVSHHLAKAIAAAAPDTCLLVDSLGTWLANLLEQDEETWAETQAELLHCLEQAQAQVILIAEETGWGVVPAYPLGRRFRDRLGTLTRKIGAIANPVYLVTGGYALNLSALGTQIDG
ncbi:MAG: bifunctional adenosylcobinamide kinase/adenosylcobinamide-phosphate guanylyltransferase [Cyanobacteria bacterium J06638_22]